MFYNALCSQRVMPSVRVVISSLQVMDPHLLTCILTVARRPSTVRDPHPAASRPAAGPPPAAAAADGWLDEG